MTIGDMIEPFYSTNGLFVGSIFISWHILKNLFKVINSNVYIALLLFGRSLISDLPILSLSRKSARRLQ